MVTVFAYECQRSQCDATDSGSSSNNKSNNECKQQQQQQPNSTTTQRPPQPTKTTTTTTQSDSGSDADRRPAELVQVGQQAGEGNRRLRTTTTRRWHLSSNKQQYPSTGCATKVSSALIFGVCARNARVFTRAWAPNEWACSCVMGLLEAYPTTYLASIITSAWAFESGSPQVKLVKQYGR